MARLYPFRALRYDPTRVNMQDVVTQPYDKVSSQMQDRYYAASPYNLIRIVLGKKLPTDTETGDNVYTRAADTLKAWQAEGILKQESAPALYGYSQTYTVPGTDEVHERRGFIALAHLHDYADHVIYRHEQTFPKHKSDRLALFKATRTYCEQIYMLYSDPTFAAENAIFAPNLAPDLEITDEYAVVHRLWRVTSPATITTVLNAMADKKLIIADGHHRYETSVAYMHERAAALGLAGGEGGFSPLSQDGNESGFSRGPALKGTGFSPSVIAKREGGALAPEGTDALPAPPFPEAAMMMTFVNMDAPGITILPTHRVAFGLPNFNGREFAANAAAYFHVEEIHATPDGHLPGAPGLLQHLNETPGTAFIAATRDGDFLLTPRPEAIAPLLTGLSPRQQALDVTQLHRVVLDKLLGLNEDTVRAGNHIRYLREATEALQQLGSGNADVAFLIKPVTLEQMKDISLNLEVMPQKSTDFYPKLLSGLAMYSLD